MQSIQSKATVQSRSSLGSAFKELKDQIKRATLPYESISAIVKGPPHHGDSHSDGGSSSEGSNRVRATDIMSDTELDDFMTEINDLAKSKARNKDKELRDIIGRLTDHVIEQDRAAVIHDLAGVMKKQREAAEDATKQASLVHTLTKSTMSAATLRNQEQR